ncbi:MAG TPA: aspartate-semialdehyde dehydrogenase [Candidatus Kapabacteria bacterium]|jgi:aspartate-semialdehyde dehydrogenase|nr:aspartate-semialdehyde dehydrogenase [Candidatus Kapabacteria bacterium]HOQ48936.1 aspartate-semialdehyde dehydrogenase [Candidatus Kapabacteria bacterium]HPU23489.1 aspartate-semialdehyde dehydrogenase [Candidatus Kapabacteria bacterium]
MKKVNLAIVGATGLVGRTFLKVLEERNFPINNLRLFASANSAGKEIIFKGEKFVIEALNEDSFYGLDIALFSAGSSVSKEYAPNAAKSGCVVIDNSSAWRRDENVPLVVPEVNPEDIFKHNGIIANPNCNVIPLAVVFGPLHKKYQITRVVVSTYQSISGAGQKGIDKLEKEIQGKQTNDKHRIFSNIIFHPIEPEQPEITNEEAKLHFEPCKILHSLDIKITSTCVRLPFFACHCEAVNIETKLPFELDEVKYLLSNSKGIIIIDDLINEDYPTPDIVKGKDEVFVGRIRRDNTIENGLNLWVVSDNIRKGAATNAIQIAEILINSEKKEVMSLG